MNRLRSTLLAMGLLSISVLAFADQAMTAWQSFAEVVPPTGDQGLSGFTLSAEVLANAGDDLADLRLLDASGAEIPFSVRVLREVNETTLILAREFNRAKVAGRISELAVDVGSAGEHNAVEIQTEGRDFRRQVEPDGSDDGLAWRVLRSDGMIFSFEANNRQAESNRISYPVSRYRYLRARVSGDSLVDRDPPTITGISVMMSVQDRGQAVTWDVDLPVMQPVRAERSPASAWLIDLGRRVPCNRLLLEALDQSFSRSFSIELADDPQNVRLVTSGEIRRRTGEERKPIVIDFNEVYARRLRLIVTDFANPPLRLSSVKASAPARQVLFEMRNSVTPPLRLFAGSPGAEAPRYDFEKDLPARLSVEPVRCELGSVQPNPTFHPEPKPFTERVPWLIYGVLAISSIVLALILISLARSIRGVRPPDSGDAEAGAVTE